MQPTLQNIRKATHKFQSLTSLLPSPFDSDYFKPLCRSQLFQRLCHDIGRQPNPSHLKSLRRHRPHPRASLGSAGSASKYFYLKDVNVPTRAGFSTVCLSGHRKQAGNYKIPARVLTQERHRTWLRT